MRDLREEYSSSWLETASLDELQSARSEVQADYGNPELDIDYRGDLWDLLHEFDAPSVKSSGKVKNLKVQHFIVNMVGICQMMIKFCTFYSK